MRLTMTRAAMLAAGTMLSTAALAATPAEILRANYQASGGAAVAQHAALHTEYAYSGQGVTGKVEEIADLKTGHYADSYTLGPVSGANGFDGKNAWEKDPSGAITIQAGGEERQTAVNQAYRGAGLWWQPDFGGAAVASDGEKSSDGSACDVLTFTPKDGRAFTAWFDAKTHLLARLDEHESGRPVTIKFSDYRAVEGAEFPGKILQTNGVEKYDQTQTLISAAFLPAQDDSVFAPPQSKLGDFTIAEGGKQTSLPFQLINNHIYADAFVNGHGPYQFIFDTGGVNLVTPATAKSQGLKSEGQFEAQGAGAGHVDTGFTHVQSLRLGKAEMKEQSFFVLPLDTLSEVEGVDETGMVGFETFRRFVTRIDYGRHVLTLIRPDAFDPSNAGVAIPIQFAGNTIEAKARYNGIEGNFTIDTGNRGALDLSNPFVIKNDLRAKAPHGYDTPSGWGIGGPTHAFVTRSGTLELGSIKLDGIVVGMSTDTKGDMGNGAQSGNIGGGILKRFVVTLDYGHQRMYLKPVSRPIADLDTFDESGMWINRDVKGFAVVELAGGGPAEAAGVQKGDVITAVNGKAAAALKLYDLRQRLRDAKPGTVEHFTVLRGDKTLHLAVTLADRL